MAKKYILFFILGLLCSNCIQASNEGLIEKIINNQLEVKNFQADIELKITTYTGQNSRFLFTYYYEEPDRVYLETEDFVLLPKEALKTLQPGFFQLDKYNYKYLREEDGLQLFELIPLDKEKEYRLILGLDLGESLIRYGEVFFQMGENQEEFAVQIDFAEIKGYSLPVYVEGRLAIPTKFGIGGEVKELKEGFFNLKLSDYYINRDFPEKIKERLNNY